MADPTIQSDDQADQRRDALSRWDNEGGAGFGDPDSHTADPASGVPGLIQPDQPHGVDPLGPVRLQIEFYDQHPEL